jgi:PAS domain S-box-containing protein
MSKSDTIKNLSSWELLAILDSIDDAVFIDDSDGIAIWCNKACQELYKVDPKDVVGLHVLELEKRGIFSPSVANRVLNEKREVTIIHENKEGKKLLSTGTPLIDDQGQIIRVITTSRDITELSNMQNQLQAVQGTLEGIKSLEKVANQEIVVASHAMFNVMQLAKRLAMVDSTVLITGESGVGKGLIAQLLHQNGNRKSSSLVTVNCGAIPENLIESELFGYERGAFTGSRADGKKGLFEVAQGGTIFLDEISELPLNLQVKLLQVIQDREIIRVGGIKKIPIDVRIISATNQDLHKLVEEGRFREDLYYRLNVVPIHVPPLRERPEDIIPLIRKYLAKFNKRLNEHKQIDQDAMAVLLKYNWPGNIRELQNIVERLILTTKETIISVENLPGFMANVKSLSPRVTDTPLTLSEVLEQAEKETLIQAMGKHQSTRSMAKALNISQPSVVRKLHKHGLTGADGSKVPEK